MFGGAPQPPIRAENTGRNGNVNYKSCFKIYFEYVQVKIDVQNGGKRGEGEEFRILGRGG